MKIMDINLTVLRHRGVPHLLLITVLFQSRCSSVFLGQLKYESGAG